MKRSLGIWIALLVLVSACGNSEPQSIGKLEGRSIFEGLYLGQGPVAKHFPELWQNPQLSRVKSALSSAQQRAANVAANRLTTTIHQIDSSFFERFGHKVQSGDNLQVYEALEEASRVTQKALIPN
jgi:SdpC family antimicrobial peptide